MSQDKNGSSSEKTGTDTHETVMEASDKCSSKEQTDPSSDSTTVPVSTNGIGDTSCSSQSTSCADSNGSTKDKTQEDCTTTDTKKANPEVEEEEAKPSSLSTSSSDSGGGEAGGSSKTRDGPLVAFKAIFNGKKYDMELPLDSTVLELKEALSPSIGVMPSMQKIMIKGLASDEKTLAELGVNRLSKVLVVGSKLNEIMHVNLGKPAGPSSSTESFSSSTKKDSLCVQKVHQKIIDKGVPDDAHPGIKNVKEALPPHPISGMVTKSGGKVRLTFKLELDQVWIGTKQRTEKINMNSIRSIVSEPIPGHEEYHLMGMQMGTTEASRYWLYWVPAQYVDAIKSTVLGHSGSW